MKKPNFKQWSILRKMLVLIIVIVGLVLLVEGVLLLLLVRSVNTHRTYWQQQTDIPVAKNAILYVALGDSTAQGIGATSPRRGYVGLVAEALSKKHNRPVHVVNLGVSGAGIQDVIDDQLPQLKQMPIDKETIVTLSAGANDLREYNQDELEKSINKLFDQLPAQTIVADVAYFGGGRYRHLEPEVQELNKIISRLAAQHNLKLAKLHEITQEKERLGVHSVDWLHPSNIGYKNWFQAFWDVLDKK